MLGDKLECINEQKYLCVVIDSKLRFKRRFLYIFNKAVRYKAIIMSHLEYCLTILYYLTDTEKNKS